MNYLVYECIGRDERYIPKCTVASSIGGRVKNFDFFAYVFNKWSLCTSLQITYKEHLLKTQK